MKRIKVEIEKLGRVINSQIEIAPMMIFSGESGMGKSYLALLSHYFFDILILQKRLSHLFEDLGFVYKDMVKSFGNEGAAFTISKEDIEMWMAKDAIAYLRYMLNADSLEGKIKVTLPDTVPSILVFKYKKEVTGLVNEGNEGVVLSLPDIKYRASQDAINDVSPYAGILSAFLILRIFGTLMAIDSTFLMPPSRGPVLSEQVVGNSGMYKDFIADVNELSNVMARPRETSSQLLEQLHDIMEGDVRKEDNRFVYVTDSVTMPISAAAASIREIAPLQLLVKKWDASRTAVLIEEPEAHLHPDKQRMMADILGCMHKFGAYLHITTHSDYFLRRINELILFQRYADNHTEQEVAQLSKETGIKLSFAIRTDDMVAYIVERQENGSSKVVAQDLRDGVPFSAFGAAVKESFRVNDLLEEALG